MEVLLSVISVSIDGFFMGVAIGFKNIKIKLNKLFIMCMIPIIMAYPVMIFGKNIKMFINNDIIKYLGFLLFIIMAINSYREIKNNKVINNFTLYNLISIGISIGLDSSVCAFTLALENYNPFITPIYFGISHFIFIFLGNYFFSKKDITKSNNLKYISPILFLLIAIFKLF